MSVQFWHVGSGTRLGLSKTCLGIWQQLYLNSLNSLNAQIITSRYIYTYYTLCWLDIILLSWCFAFKYILPFLVSPPAIYRQSVRSVQRVRPQWRYATLVCKINVGLFYGFNQSKVPKGILYIGVVRLKYMVSPPGKCHLCIFRFFLSKRAKRAHNCPNCWGGAVGNHPGRCF